MKGTPTCGLVSRHKGRLSSTSWSKSNCSFVVTDQQDTRMSSEHFVSTTAVLKMTFTMPFSAKFTSNKNMKQCRQTPNRQITRTGNNLFCLPPKQETNTFYEIRTGAVVHPHHFSEARQQIHTPNSDCASCANTSIRSVSTFSSYCDKQQQEQQCAIMFITRIYDHRNSQETRTKPHKCT